MKNSQQAVLIYLSNWMEERFRKTYTDGDFREIAGKSLEIISDVAPEELEAAKEFVFDQFSEDALASLWRDEFPRMYLALEEEVEGGTLLGMNTGSMDERTIETYVKPYETCCKRIGSLVDRLRAKFDEIFPKELSKDDIETAFKEEFPGPQDYAESYDASKKALMLALSFKAARGEMDQKEFDYMRRVSEKLRDKFKDINRRMFADLYETGEEE